MTSPAVLGRRHEVASVNDDLFIDAALSVSVFEPLVGRDARLVDVQIEEAHSPDIIAVSAIPTEAGAASIAHPQLRLLLLVRGKHAVLIGVVAEVLVSIWS